MKWINCLDKPIRIYGLLDGYRRLPAEITDKVNSGVTELALHTAGGRVRFATDSAALKVRVKLRAGGMMNHMPLSGMSGVDFYVDGLFRGAVRPENPGQTEYEGGIVGENKMGQVTINLPLYNGLTEIYIGIEDNADIAPPQEYRVAKPVVFYGSSITQGGCASRPGNAYTAVVTRRADADHINLGFSGSGRGESVMARYIASLSMSAFVMDYDHNAPSADHLRATHKPFFKIIREAQPTLPVIFISKPDFDSDPVANAIRRDIINETFVSAQADGDRGVYFVDGQSLFGTRDRDACTVDTCHPNDLGFMRMAEHIYPALKKVL
ncbi:MAG: SGNH/GDSL hydrolase family protein [Eubacteriales bacterium]|nr:SGNH/GDSL hydrolase family protein [Eubacteriales bacterium]